MFTLLFEDGNGIEDKQTKAKQTHEQKNPTQDEGCLLVKDAACSPTHFYVRGFQRSDKTQMTCFWSGEGWGHGVSALYPSTPGAPSVHAVLRGALLA